jgi:hypothetical protein
MSEMRRRRLFATARRMIHSWSRFSPESLFAGPP